MTMTGPSYPIWFYLTLGLLVLLPVGKPEERNFRIIIEEFVPKAGVTTLFDDLSCKLKQINMRSYLTCNFRLTRQVDEVKMDSSLDLLRPKKPVVRLYNVHFDACQYLTMQHKNPLFGVFKKSINDAFNDTLKCPLKAVNEEIILKFHSLIQNCFFLQNFNYTLSNWFINENNFPSIVPECNVKALTKLQIENKVALTLILRGRVMHIK